MTDPGNLTPQLRLDREALDHNIATMSAWCEERGVVLAPHVKTTMSEPIVARQVAAGAVAVTVATLDQAASVLSWGHSRVLVANEVVDGPGLARLRGLIEDDPAREIRCFVDSAAGVAAAGAVFDAGCVLEVLIDVGTPDGRTGVRSIEESLRLAEAVAGVSPVPGLIPALSVRAVVVSAPEQGLVVVGAGKRDLPYDAGPPVLLSARTSDGEVKSGAGGTIRQLFDHHAVLTGATGLEVSDLVDFGISHPCSVFDRWTDYVVTASAEHQVGVWKTDFGRSGLA